MPIPKDECKFVHPSEFGFSTPINTKEELCRISKAISGIPDKTHTENVELKKQIESFKKQLGQKLNYSI